MSARRYLAMRPFLFVVAATCASLLPVRPVQAKLTDEQIAMVDRVMQRLLAVAQEPEGYDAWPPTWKLIDSDEENAFATTVKDERPKKVPMIRVYRGLLENVAQMNEHRLAFVLGHELAHLLCGHVINAAGETAVTAAAFGREAEIEADVLGMQLAVKAGFSYREAMGAPQRFRDMGHEYTSFEGIGTDHPSWSERLSLLETDERQAEYWRAASAFETGVFLLQAQNYASAEPCFEQVVKDFPKCHEAWVNLGYAQLMQYCDALEPDDLREFGIGQLIVGGFYQRPEAYRGAADEDLWWSAVGAFQRALTLKPDLLLAKANLALAYLVQPSGKPDVGKAAKLYSEVEAMLRTEGSAENVDPLTRAALLSNAWVGVFHTDAARGAAVMEQVNRYLQMAENSRGGQAGARQVRAALRYTQATSLAAAGGADQQREALRLFEEYLAATPSSSSWWPLAYEQYTAAAAKLSVTPKSEAALAKSVTSNWRLASGVATPGGVMVTISTPTKKAVAALGESATGEELIAGRFVKRYDYPEQGIAILGDRRVFAIVLAGPNAPALELRRNSLGAQVESLSIGMPRATVEALLGDAWTSTNTSIIDPKKRHEFYEKVGVAVRYEDGKVAEIIVTVAADFGSDKGLQAPS